MRRRLRPPRGSEASKPRTGPIVVLSCASNLDQAGERLLVLEPGMDWQDANVASLARRKSGVVLFGGDQRCLFPSCELAKVREFGLRIAMMIGKCSRSCKLRAQFAQ